MKISLITNFGIVSELHIEAFALFLKKSKENMSEFSFIKLRFGGWVYNRINSGFLWKNINSPV